MRTNGSLGLVSMGARGRFSVDSYAGKGTKVEVQVPIAGAVPR